MILDDGDKILMVHRRLYPEDAPRYFIGEVETHENDLVQASGHTWIKDRYSGNMMKKKDVRTKIFSIATGSLIVYRLPESADLDNAGFVVGDNGEVILSDGTNFEMDLTETYVAGTEQPSRTARTPA